MGKKSVTLIISMESRHLAAIEIIRFNNFPLEIKYFVLEKIIKNNK